MIPFKIGMTNQEYSVFQYYTKKGEYLDEMGGTFIVENIYTEPNTNCVLIEGVTDSVDTAYKVGHWIGMMDEVYQKILGKDYKLTIPYTENEN